MEDIILKKVDDIAEQMIKSIIEIVKIDSVENSSFRKMLHLAQGSKQL